MISIDTTGFENERFFVIGCNDLGLEIYDKTDGTVEVHKPEYLYWVLKQGIKICGLTLDDSNPMFTFHGMKVNLFHPNHLRVGKFYVAYLPAGSKYGSTLSSSVNKPTVMFYDASVKNFDRHTYPFGQQIYSYHAESILNHRGRLMLDADVPEWTVPAESIEVIKNWIRSLA